MGRAVKIALWCLAVGLALAFFGIEPGAVWRWAGETARGAAAWIAEAALWAWPYMLAGAAIVVPIVVVAGLLRARRRRRA